PRGGRGDGRSAAGAEGAPAAAGAARGRRGRGADPRGVRGLRLLSAPMVAPPGVAVRSGPRPRLRVFPSGRRAGGAAEAERVAGRVDVHPEAARGGGLVLVHGRAERERPRLGRVDVGDGEVEVELLRVLAVGPGGAPVV